MSKLARVTLPQALAYRGGQPMFAWLLHRISALGIVIFVGMHLTMAFLVYATTESVTNDVANWLTTFYALAPVQIFVLFCVLYHATNGLRIVILDMWPALHRFNQEAMWVQWALFLPMFLLPAALIAMGVTLQVMEGPMSHHAPVTRRVSTGNKTEATMWFFMRISGVLLLLLGAFGLVYANLIGGYGKLDAGAQMRWSFFPISFHVQSSDVEVYPNFSNPFWQTYAFLLIGFAAVHAYNGLRAILRDYVRHPLLLNWLQALLLVLWIFMVVAAIYVIFVFSNQ